VGQLGNVGTLVGVSANPLTATEQIVLNVHELAGNYYVAVSGHTDEAVGQPYTLTATIAMLEPYEPITYTIPITFPTPATDVSVETLILFNGSRIDQLYNIGTLVFTSTDIADRLDTLSVHPQVNGRVVNLDDYPEIVFAYQVWDAQIDNPLAANFVAAHIKSLLYNLAPAYPNLKYLVIVGDDRVIPHRRIRDEALMANERHYASTSYADNLKPSLELRYFLSDDYYAGLLPLPWRGRELYLPQFATGRLVETPQEIATAIDAFLAQPVAEPTNALVTGYDFLLDQATAISDTLTTQGIAALTTLINDDWTTDNLRSVLISVTNASDLNSLNAHFTHFGLIPASIPASPATDEIFVFATEITDTTDYTGDWVFSIGCHSGLNVPDEPTDLTTTTDWAQAFLRQGATFIGNTGYGYGDSDLIAYSERLMTNFVEELDERPDGQPQTIGNALVAAKQLYYNSAAAASLSNYDEKVMGIMTIYGLPMLQIDMPFSSVGQLATKSPTAGLHSSAFTITTVNLGLAYDSHTVSGLGNYYTVQGENDVHVSGGRPIEPRTSQDVHATDTVAHGAVMVGGTFADIPAFDPFISRVVTEEIQFDEPVYPATEWYPAQLGTVNRFLSIGGQSRERLVVVPGQFKASPSVGTLSIPTTGTQRLYTDLTFDVYHAPFTATDFIAPSIWQVEAISSTHYLRFRVQVTDNSWHIQRTLVLYRTLDSNTWSPAELTYNTKTGWAEGWVGGASGPIEYFAQAVDPTGNVALGLDHGTPFDKVKPGEEIPTIYLPVVTKNYSGPNYPIYLPVVMR
jgi:hypothetical protein